MKKQVFYIHGGDSFSKQEDFLQSLKTVTLRDLPDKVKEESWKANLPSELGEGYEVFMPSMPNKQDANFTEWSIWFERHFEYLRDGVILVGCSLGGMFLAKYLSENDLPFKPGRVFLLAAPCGYYTSNDGNDCGTFQFPREALKSLQNKGLNIEIWHSKDDFVVPFDHALEYAAALPDSKTRFFEDKNHFLLPTLPELIEAIKAEK